MDIPEAIGLPACSKSWIVLLDGEQDLAQTLAELPDYLALLEASSENTISQGAPGHGIASDTTVAGGDRGVLAARAIDEIDRPPRAFVHTEPENWLVDHRSVAQQDSRPRPSLFFA